MDRQEREFREMLARLSPRAQSCRRCIQLLNQVEGKLDTYFQLFLDAMLKGSLNARARLLYLLEIGATCAQKRWNDLVAANLQKVVDAAVPVHLAPGSMINLSAAQTTILQLLNCGVVTKVDYLRIMDQLEAKKSSLGVLQEMHRSSSYDTSAGEVLRRMEDDRERSKTRRLCGRMKLRSLKEFELVWTGNA